jgi:hypothetical protein
MYQNAVNEWCADTGRAANDTIPTTTELTIVSEVHFRTFVLLSLPRLLLSADCT